MNRIGRYNKERQKVLKKFLEDMSWIKGAAKDDDRLLSAEDWRRNWESYIGMIIDDTERLKSNINDITERETAEKDEN